MVMMNVSLDTTNINVINRVAMAQGKQGIWMSIFPDRENREFGYNTGKN